MNVYHCLVQTRPGGVPELRDLACETDEDIPAAVAWAIREWAEVERVEVFRDGEAVAVFPGGDLSKPGASGPRASRPETP